MTLRDRWRALLAPLGGPTLAIEDAFTRLEARYAEPHRHYHNLAHIEAVVSALERLTSPSPALSFAALFHDAVYDPQRADNEEESAALARVMLPPLHVPPEIVEETARLILLTKSHQTNDDDTEGLALLDADLGILSAPQGVYDAYAVAIRREYDWVPEGDYRAGRAAVLGRFLARPRLYHHSAMNEATARRNLERELSGLRL